MTNPDDMLKACPEATDRVCSVCHARVAAFDRAMVCHCYEMPWVRDASIQPADDAVVELETLLRSLMKGEYSSLTIGFNDLHAPNYDTAQKWSDEMGNSDGMQTYNDLRDWVSPEEREKALAENSVWSVQWYPDTPVGFCSLLASSLPKLVAALAALAPQGEKGEG